MLPFSTEAIIALITLIVTIPLIILGIWKLVERHKRRQPRPSILPQHQSPPLPATPSHSFRRNTIIIEEIEATIAVAVPEPIAMRSVRADRYDQRAADGRRSHHTRFNTYRSSSPFLPSIATPSD